MLPPDKLKWLCQIKWMYLDLDNTLGIKKSTFIQGGGSCWEVTIPGGSTVFCLRTESVSYTINPFHAE